MATYVFQGFDGKIYGEERNDSPQTIGKINAQLRRDGSKGRWVLRSSLSLAECRNRGDLNSATLLLRGENFVIVAA